MATPDVDAVIARWSRRQHGAFSRSQVLDAGGSEGLIRHRVRSGRWLRLAPGVYAFGAVKPTWERQVMAGTLVHAGLVAAAGSTAAVLHRVDGFHQGRPQLLVPHGTRSANPLSRVRRTRHLLPTDVVRIDGIPTLTLERLVVDLARDVDRRTLSRVMDRGVIARKLDPDRLLDRAGAILRPGQSEALLVSELLAERWTGKPPAASELEAVMFDLLDAAGYDDYDRQAVLPWFEPALGGVVVDSLFPQYRFILEGDGRLWHARLEQWERDHLRDAVALEHGFITMRVTWRMLTQSPEQVERSVARWVRPI